MKHCINRSASHCLDEAVIYAIDYTINTSVSEGFRELLLTSYPSLRKKASYRRLAAYLLFSEFIDEDTGHPIAEWATLGHIEGRDKQVYQKLYDGAQFLEEFQSEVMTSETFSWSNYQIILGKARVITVKWSEEIIQSRKEEHLKHHKKIKRVNIVTGRKINPRDHGRRNKWRRAKAVEAVPLNHPAKKVIQYLHARSEKIYSKKVRENVEKTRDLIDKLPPAKKIGPRIRDRQHNILTQIIDCPKPIYTTARWARTDRIFAVPPGYMGLKRDIKKTLLSGYRDYDLKSSQLAICAYLWEVPEVIEFLEEGGCIWKSMLQYLGQDPNMKNNDRRLYDAVKEPLKRLLYQSIFGMQERGLRHKLITEADILWKLQAIREPTDLLRHPIISTLIAARDRQMETIRSRGYAVTCFGRRINVSDGEKTVRSALAQQAQAIELDLLLPVIDVAEQSRSELQIILWCHDGFIAEVRQSDRTQLWDDRLKETVRARAAYHGMKMELESEQL